MKKYAFPFILMSTTVVLSCGNGGNKESETVTDTTTSLTTTDTSALAGNTGMTGTTYSSTPLTGADTTFVKEAANGGMMEVELGNLAQQNGTNPRVKSFGEMMVRDHSKANDELKSLASAKNMLLPDSMNKKTGNMWMLCVR